MFAVDWFLYHMMNLWMFSKSFQFTGETYILKVVAHCLAYGNSCSNPILYAFVSTRYRKTFIETFTCKSDKKGSEPLRLPAAIPDRNSVPK